MVNVVVRELNALLAPVNKVLKNEYVTALVAVFVTLYASSVAPRLPSYVSDLFGNFFFRLLMLTLIGFIANKNPAVSLLMATAFLVTLMMLNRQESEEGFLDALDSFRSEKFTEQGVSEEPQEGAPEPVAEEQVEQENPVEQCKARCEADAAGAAGPADASENFAPW